MYNFEVKSTPSAAERILLSTLYVHGFRGRFRGAPIVEVTADLTALLSKEKTLRHSQHGVPGELELAVKNGQLIITTARADEAGVVQWERLAVIKYESSNQNSGQRGTISLAWLMSELTAKSGSASQAELSAIQNIRYLGTLPRAQQQGLMTLACGNNWSPTDVLFDIKGSDIVKLVKDNAGRIPAAQQDRLIDAITKATQATFVNSIVDFVMVDQFKAALDHLDAVATSINGWFGFTGHENPLSIALNILRFNEHVFFYNDTKIDVVNTDLKVIGKYSLTELGLYVDNLSGLAGIRE